eukprot:764440-Rhodomonas_salina.1
MSGVESVCTGVESVCTGVQRAGEHLRQQRTLLRAAKVRPEFRCKQVHCPDWIPPLATSLPAYSAKSNTTSDRSFAMHAVQRPWL